MMQTQKKPSNKKADSKNSTKASRVKKENVLKKQNVKAQFEDLKKQVEKFKIVADNTKSDNETPTTNTQTSISFDKNEVLGVEKEPKNYTGGITMKDNITNSTTDTEKNVSAGTTIGEVKPLIIDDDDEYDVVTVRVSQPIQENKVKPLIIDDDDEYDVITVRVKPPISTDDNKETKTVTNEKTPIQTNINETKAVVMNEKQSIQANDTNKVVVVGDVKTEGQDKEVNVKTHEEKKKELSNETELINEETKQIKSIEAQKQARREAIKNLFEATGGNIPAMFNEVNKELKDLMKTDKVLKLDTINFSDDLKSFRTPTFANSYNLDSATDFFGMKIEDQELLFDRIGLFKGVVVDYSKENAIEQGYRDVVKHLIKDQENDDKRSKPVRVFYKKPRLSGFYETTYSFDEYQKKSQEAGVFNLGLGLTASYNSGFVSAGAKAGYSYSKESLSEKSTHIKEISIVSSFFLPKIELSFDTLQSCASDDLIAYLEQALENEKDTIACFDRINTILMSYGQFVPTSLVIGARIYSSDTKKLKQDETVDNVLTKHATEFKAAVSSKFFEGGLEVQVKSENSSKNHEKSTSEAQHIQFNAIGGEGAFVANMDKWVASTADSKGWGLVRFDNLVPVIDVLPAELQKRITTLFNRVIEEYTIEDLLNKGAQFLFHKGYFERFGSKAQPKFCIIKNSIGGKQVLSVKVDGELENNQEVIMAPYDGEGGDIQEWYFANSGKIYLKHNYNTNNKFVLSIDTSKRPVVKLVITQDNYFNNQYWDARGGMIKSLDNDEFFINYDGERVQLEAKDKASNSTWLLIPEKEINTPSKRRIEPERKNTLMLLDGVSDSLEKNYYLPLEGTLKSQNGYAQLKFSADKIAILWGKGQKEIWSYSIAKPGASKLAMTNGSFAVLDETDNILEEIATDVADIRLMDSGNLEAVNPDDDISWETNSIVYAYIQRASDKKAFSIGVGFEKGKTVYKYINTQPYIGGDHQHWYINRKGNIVSKYTDNKQKFALTEIIIDPLNPAQKAQEKLTDTIDKYTSALDIIPAITLFKGVAKFVEGELMPTASSADTSRPTKSSYLELGVLNSINTKGQQWKGLVPNRKGSIQNQVSKNVTGPNDNWELLFDENAKQEANMPVVSYSQINTDEYVIKYNLYKYWHSLGFNDIHIKGQDVRAVRMNGEYWDKKKEAYHLKLEFRNSNGLIIESRDVEDGRYFSNGFHVPGLGGAAYFSDETQTLSMKLASHKNETGNYVGSFQFETDNQKFAAIDLQKVNPYYYNDDTQLNSICSAWVEIPYDHKAIGVAFVKVSDSMISPCLISIKK